MASKFCAQRCRSKTAALDPLCIACFARSAQSRPTPSHWYLGTAHVVSLICAVRPSTRLTSPDLRSPNIDDVHPGETTMIFV
uniref:Uncharacterized protein n=1 Tax=Zea mays TaxID=4577 RepID=B6UGF1_MAIZE|nr:hypothetical protein [Zea mays]